LAASEFHLSVPCMGGATSGAAVGSMIVVSLDRTV
jgi:hypothetical protein